MKLISKAIESFKANSDRNAFCINSIYYTYGDLIESISSIRSLIKDGVDLDQKNIGLITNDDLQTYAAIFALWLEGKSYIPLNPSAPVDRNSFVLKEIGCDFVIDSSETLMLEKDFDVISTKELQSAQPDLEPVQSSKGDLAYILFTSGSTGLPKGVSITFENITAFVDALEVNDDHKITSEDRCLQMFDLTFDFSMLSFLRPLLYGACIYTIPQDQIKYFYIYKLIVEAELTCLFVVPSVIYYLRPYFEEINATNVRYCCFGGAALDTEIVNEWKQCIPNSNIYNVYGPSECTVIISYYSLFQKTGNKSLNGVVSLGKVIDQIIIIIIDNDNNIVDNGEKGELALAGNQLTPGYCNNKQKNKESFFVKDYKGKQLRFYKTGDLCFQDNDGDLFFVGRKDFQAKIRGYRVELSEIEFQIKQKLNKLNLIVIDFVNELGNTEIGLAVESEVIETKKVFDYIKTKLPDYMIPTQTRFIHQLPLSNNGKIDRDQVRQYFN